MEINTFIITRALCFMAMGALFVMSPLCAVIVIFINWFVAMYAAKNTDDGSTVLSRAIANCLILAVLHYMGEWTHGMQAAIGTGIVASIAVPHGFGLWPRKDKKEKKTNESKQRHERQHTGWSGKHIEHIPNPERPALQEPAIIEGVWRDITNSCKNWLEKRR